VIKESLMFPSSANTGILFVLCIAGFIGCSGCFSEPVKSGPPIQTKVSTVKTEANRVPDVSHEVESASLKEEPGILEPVGLLESSAGPLWDKELTSVIPSGFVCLGAFRGFPASLSLDGGNLPLILSSASVGRLVEALRNKVSKTKSFNPNLGDFFNNRPFAFALMPVAGSELARFIFITASGGEFEDLVRSFPLKDCQNLQKDSNVYLFEKDLAVNVASIGKLLVLSSDREILGGVHSVLKNVSASMDESPLSNKFRPLVSKDALGYVYCDLPAMVGSIPGFPSVDGAVAVAAGPSPLEKRKLFSSVRGAMIEVSALTDSSIDLQGIVLKRDIDSKAKVPETIIGTRIAGETIDAMLSFSLDVAVFENEKDIISLMPDSIASMFQAAIDRSKSTVSAGGIDFDKEIKPFIDSELSLILSWKIKYPQLAVLLKIKDSAHWVSIMSRLRSHLESNGYVFDSRKVGEQFVYFTREQSISSDVFEPAFVITPQFLILASGRHVLESILLDQEKLEGTELISDLFRQFNGRVENLLYFNTDLLGRFIESGERKMAIYSPAAHGQCNANMVQMKATGKATMFCPVGGSYQITDDSIECSLHGTVDAPLDPAKQIRDSLKTVKAVQQKYQGLVVGTSREDDNKTRFRLILRGRTSSGQ
jgi:hypothetical protein